MILCIQIKIFQVFPYKLHIINKLFKYYPDFTLFFFIKAKEIQIMFNVTKSVKIYKGSFRLQIMLTINLFSKLGCLDRVVQDLSTIL